jgi:hypothetical protein
MGKSEEGAWRQALLDAADYLESHEWIQHQSQTRNDGAVCIVGAIATVCVYSKPYARALKELTLSIGRDPLMWNDQPGRTKQEVIAKLRACARRP